ncbi:MAG: SET domain-containing protein-lysine N-methyltransferase [Planctomycetota bacterium]
MHQGGDLPELMGSRSSVVPTTNVGVARIDGAFRVIAAHPIHAGDVILSIDGVVTSQPTRLSVQVGPTEHIDLPKDSELLDELDRYPWRFLNHSCAPSADLRGRELIALRDIGVLEEITFDYDTTEYAMAAPFACLCGAESCRGHVRGFRFLSAAQRMALDGTVAPHVLALWHGEPRRG